MMNAPTDNYDNPVEVTLDLDIDLMKLLFFDPFTGENFMKCIFRYYPYLSTYAKEVFIRKL